MKTEPLNRSEKYLIIASVVLLLAGIGFAYWHYAINVNPVVTIPPPPPMLSPNARDFYMQAFALRSATFGTVPGKTAGQKIPLSVSQAYECTHGGIISPPLGVNKGTPPPSLATLQAALRKNAPVFAKIHQGFAYPYQEIPQRSFDEIGSNMLLRQLCLLCAVAGNVRGAAGDWDGAAERYLDAIRIGADAGSILCAREGRWELWTALGHLSGRQVRRGIRRLEAMRARRVPYTQRLREAKIDRQAALMAWFHEPNWRGYLFSAKIKYGSEYDSSRALRFSSKRAIMADYTRYMDALIAYAAQPYSAARARPPLPANPISRELASSGGNVRYLANNCQHDLLLISLALRAYALDHGRYPTGLRALVSAYLKILPPDPFANQSFRYQLHGKSYQLYSIGPDGRDDGGTPSADGKGNLPGTSPNSFVPPISENSTGDIVAGVNTN